MRRLSWLWALFIPSFAVAQPSWHPYWRDQDVVLLLDLNTIEWHGEVATVVTTWTPTGIWTRGDGIYGEPHPVDVDCRKYADTVLDMRALWSEICLRYKHTRRTNER